MREVVWGSGLWQLILLEAQNPIDSHLSPLGGELGATGSRTVLFIPGPPHVLLECPSAQLCVHTSVDSYWAIPGQFP